MLTPSSGFCSTPLIDFEWGEFGCFQDGGSHVVDVMPLAADFALGLKPGWPVHDHAVPRSTKVGGHLFRPLERGVGRHRPAAAHVREGIRSPPVVGALQHALDRLRVEDAVQVNQLVEGSFKAALGARAVVAHDVDDQGVV